MGNRLHLFAASLTAAMVTVGAPALAAINVTNTGGFSDATPATSASSSQLAYCGGGSSQPACPGGTPPYQVKWGQPAGSGGQSALGYTPHVANDVGADPFVIGTLKHTNLPIYGGTEITSVKLRIATTVADTTRTVTFNDAVTFTLNVDEVPNEVSNCPGSANPCPDFIRLPAGGVAFDPVDLGNMRYQLTLLGFRAPGSSVVQTTMTSQEGGSSTVELVGQVTKQSLLDADAGPDQAVDEGDAVTLDGTGSQVSGLDYTWTQTAGPTVTLSDPHAAQTTFTAPEVASDQTVRFQLTVADQLEPTYTDTDAVDVLIRQVNKAPVVSAGGPYSGAEGSPVALIGTATDGDHDPLTLAWTYTAGPDVDPGATCTFSDASAVDPILTCTDDGTFQVRLSADDGNGGVTSDAQTVMLTNAAPVLGTVSSSTSAPLGIGSAVTVTAPFTDAGTHDTHTCGVEWGDGSPVASDSATGQCTGSHTYAEAGIYTVTVTVTDDDGGTDTGESSYVVVYDPSAGFVTGGGWIMSPRGAYTAAPDLTGKANFGFVAKYKKGASTPDGETQFMFQAAGLDFHSTSYQWLVVAGAKAQYKGDGTVNGRSGYGFMLTARDGDRAATRTADTLRLKIWDKSTGAVVYDNGLGAADSADPSTALANGSIVIHG
ncbi:choice-of-anchor K domain-containing protein [Nocardioides marmoribigeumensis]|uniref:PKD repeat protein n=1 Tax=Nocardioides marmoribigeumensis TaxID=433649 RepID=A0ABU2BQ51_9ACTN|nr:choice-of-anchor K domain-containing protein [Nocardioides marmoribigeumensis]MDR7360750.1 PKD repeat protein [Nocardioides marmoribigeumensis]